MPKSILTLIEGRIRGLELVDLTEAVVCTYQDLLQANSGVRSLHIPSGCLNTLDTLDLSRFHSLKRLQVDSQSCRGVNQLSLEGMAKLQQVKVGEDSFSLCDKETHCIHNPNEEGRVQQMKRSLILRSNPELTRVVIGRGSFADYVKLVLEGRNDKRMLSRSTPVA